MYKCATKSIEAYAFIERDFVIDNNYVAQQNKLQYESIAEAVLNMNRQNVGPRPQIYGLCAT